MHEYEKVCRDLNKELDDRMREADAAADSTIELANKMKDYKRATDRYLDSLDDLADTISNLF